MEHALTTTLQKWGNSQGIRIPKMFLEAMNWSCSEELVIKAEKDRIIVEKAGKRQNIKEMFADFHGEYTPEVIDWGKPVGDEVW